MALYEQLPKEMNMLLVEVWKDRFFVGTGKHDVFSVETVEGVEAERTKRGIRPEAVFVDEIFRTLEIREMCRKYGYNPVRYGKNPIATLIDEMVSDF